MLSNFDMKEKSIKKVAFFSKIKYRTHRINDIIHVKLEHGNTPGKGMVDLATKRTV